MSLKVKLKKYVRPGEGAPGERALVQKLDFFILTFCCLMYFLNYVCLERKGNFSFRVLTSLSWTGAILPTLMSLG